LFDPDLLAREWAEGGGGCEAYRGCYSNTASDHQLLIDAIEQEVEFDDQVDTVVCIDDDTTTKRLSPGSEAAKKEDEEKDEEKRQQNQQQKSRIVDRAHRLLDNISDGLFTKFNTNLISIPESESLQGRAPPIIRPTMPAAPSDNDEVQSQILKVNNDA